MAQSYAQSTYHHPLQPIAVSGKQPAAQKAGNGSLQKVDGSHQQGTDTAVIAEIVGEACVSAAVGTDIVMDDELGNQDCTVDVAQQVARSDNNQNQKNHDLLLLVAFLANGNADGRTL